MSIRGFIAIPLTDELKAGIGDMVGSLKKTGADVKWVKPENLHLTLKFLGNIDMEKTKSITYRISEIAGGYDDFEFMLNGTGVFPGNNRPRIIWIGIRDHMNLIKIAKKIDAAMKGEGFEPEKRPFNPHITIGRARSSKGIDKLIPELVKYRSMNFGTQKAESIHLMKSTLKKRGAEYSSIFSAPLRRNS
ncbi:2'-5'-RNA ligase [bacterium BMS3Bbin05]|nr:2'-5'-RNA ligase [bacterium BMS3Bbin05]HDL19736.1 RNA 2',3'-cyclic phosphodiesterase [Nitrospirota bacterium]HDO23516.1 RNA 2',3'-cyclic phosphodiesterase [Nitrospirota bacterium]HDZ87223.1 RNA 2',3'-cyclic phosphodiesterase [Nitrospirota bacterium]